MSLGHHRTHPKVKLLGPPDWQGTAKYRYRSRTRTAPRKERFEPTETKKTENETPHQDKIQ